MKCIENAFLRSINDGEILLWFKILKFCIGDVEIKLILAVCDLLKSITTKKFDPEKESLLIDIVIMRQNPLAFELW
jgi:hypothetical protein